MSYMLFIWFDDMQLFCMCQACFCYAVKLSGSSFKGFGLFAVLLDLDCPETYIFS